MQIGKAIRLERITNRATKNAVIVPMDHGVTVGPIAGLVDLPSAVDKVATGGADAVLGHVGLPRLGHRGYGQDVGLILHLSASTSLAPDSNHKVLVSSVERAIRYGADGVSIHVNLGAEDESGMLRDFGDVAMACEEWGMPLLAMVYTRGPKISNEYGLEVVKQAARVGAELGADIVKVVYTGDSKSFRQVVEGAGGNLPGGIRVVIAGGEKMETDEEVLTMVAGAMEAGGAGVSIGRNVFQHANPEKMVAALVAIVHQGKSVDEAMKVLAE